MQTSPHPFSKYPAAPRYTSYPTAPHFHLLDEGTRQEWLAALPEAPVSLYVHVPYCPKQCWFCGCHTRITRRYEPVAGYLDTLYDEMRLVAQAIGRRQAVGHIHFGGGSPSMLHPQDFVWLMSHLAEHFSILPDAEIAIELDPRGVNEAKIAAYAFSGVNRLSLGLQDFAPEVQVAINRPQPLRLVYDTMALAREYGLKDISVDLVYGLPKQTLAGFEETLRMVIMLRPTRLALFGYAHVPWVKKGMRLIDPATLPDTELRCAMAQRASDLLQAAGYVSIGLDHFALPEDSMAQAAARGTLRRNFQGYTTDAHSTLIGLGASALSHMPQGYVQNPPRIETYAEQVALGHLPQEKGWVLSDDDKLRKQAIELLMCNMEIDLGEYCLGQGQEVDALDAALPALAVLAQEKLITLAGRQVTINPHYLQAVRLACAAFDAYLARNAAKHSQVA